MPQATSGRRGSVFPRAYATVAAWAFLAFLVWSGGAGAANSSAAGRLGVYVGAGNASGVREFGQWLGAPLGYEEDYLPTDTWPSVASTTWLLDRWRTSGRRLVLSVPLVPASGGSLAAGARGDYDRWFASLARQLVAHGQDDAILRLGWEFNGSWYRWAVRTDSDARTFAAYFREIVKTMRASAPHLQFDWNPSIGVWPTFDLPLAYPGDDYVDFIGMDVYDQSWIANYLSPTARWADFVHQRYGLAWQRAFARAHHKPVSFPEWGVTTRPDGHGGGDDPFFVSHMAAWFKSSNLGYSIYFDYDASDGAHALDAFPASAAAFRRAFCARRAISRSAQAAERPHGHRRRRPRGRHRQRRSVRGRRP